MRRGRFARVHGAAGLVELAGGRQRRLVRGVLQLAVQGRQAGIIKGDPADGDQREQRESDGRRDGAVSSFRDRLLDRAASSPILSAYRWTASAADVVCIASTCFTASVR